MPRRKERKPARISPTMLSNVRKAMQGQNFEVRTGAAMMADMEARNPRVPTTTTLGGRKGSFKRKADQNRLATMARQIRLDATSKSQNNYEFGSREDAQAQHRSRYRALRTAFGMSAG